jgi:hypothetical protein
MALRYLLDEHFRGDVWRAILHHNAHSGDSIDVVRVGDPPDLPLSTPDSEILDWAERAGRVLISRDRRTMIAELATHIQAGRTAPGLFIIRPRSRLADVLAFLVEAAHAGDEDQWRDQVTYIPSTKISPRFDGCHRRPQGDAPREMTRGSSVGFATPEPTLTSSR